MLLVLRTRQPQRRGLLALLERTVTAGRAAVAAAHLPALLRLLVAQADSLAVAAVAAGPVATGSTPVLAPPGVPACSI